MKVNTELTAFSANVSGWNFRNNNLVNQKLWKNKNFAKKMKYNEMNCVTYRNAFHYR